MLGTVFEGRYDTRSDGTITPHITGNAYLTGETTLLIEDGDQLPG